MLEPIQHIFLLVAILKILFERLIDAKQNDGVYLAYYITVTILIGNAATNLGTLPSSSGPEYLN